MVRGCQKKIIVMKNISSSFFDEAHFILKDSAAGKPLIDEGDMIAEAHRIILENQYSASAESEDSRSGRSPGACAGWFTAGVFSGGIIMAIAFILL